jgi:hypothetical protein
MKMMTKSCSTYLSQNCPHCAQTVKRMLWPLDSCPATYDVHKVGTGSPHSIQIGILDCDHVSLEYALLCVPTVWVYKPPGH